MKSFTSIALLAGLTSMAVNAQQLELNDSRYFDFDENTQITRNGDPVGGDLMIQIGTGYQIQIQIGTGTPDLQQGTLVTIDFDDRLVGPVTSVDPLEVFSIPVVATGDTELFGIPGDDLANLNIGDEIYISGYSDLDSSVLASRIELPTDPITTWRIEGYASNVTATTLNIGAQPIDYSSALVSECNGSVPADAFVDVEAVPVVGFVAGSTLSVEELDCDLDRLDGDGNAVVEGIITAVAGPNSFTVGEQVILTTENTVYENGTIDDIEVGVRVEVEGNLAPAMNELEATKVKIREIKTRFEAPVSPADVTPGESITIMQNTFLVTAQTRDEDGIIAGGLGTERQVEVRGFVDLEGTLWATRVRDRDEPNLTETEVRGPASNIAEPNLTILGVSVDTTGAQFEDALGNPLTSGEFFAAIVEGMPVGVEDAQYDPIMNAVSGGVVSIEDEGVDDNRSASAPQGESGQAIGVITGGLGDLLFIGNFENPVGP